MVRRLVDVVCAAIALVATAPLLALAAVGIRRASPGSIYSSTHGAALLQGSDPEAAYVARLLPLKLALDAVYVRRASLAYDARIAGRTLWVIVTTLLGRRRFPDPPELPEARRLLADADPTTFLPPGRNIATA